MLINRLRRGFSLSEVLICLGVVSIAFLGTFASLICSQRAVGVGQRMSIATGYCRQICEIVRARGLAYSSGTVPASGSDLQTAEGVTNTPLNQGAAFSALPNDGKYTRSINTVRVANNGFGFNLYRVTVAVYWKEGKRLNKVSMVTLARVPLT
ncbi:MAG: prepilin-type N-terminal cleavage/methylation domain-containing protein [Candidatus Eremiobacteraeota bacterium]|nr:prepilin-type N-terminal cleavage/methylation domain-containing protein [Candidatus Eremiobacteraeota bacterium]MCW5870344.1 prepilin-type N-terminal cleavage/methylation domain-containing protein [Candidatus Eremiobacteraeota bacterium]